MLVPTAPKEPVDWGKETTSEKNATNWQRTEKRQVFVDMFRFIVGIV